MDLLLTSTVPIGAGLSSSAAVEIATATLLEAMTECHLDPLEKARLCQRAEHEYAGTPCGIMDLLVAAAAAPGSALLIDCRNAAYEPVPLPDPAQAVVLVADTGVRRALVKSAYAERRRACAAAAAQLALSSLREATMGMVAAAGLPQAAARCARHVISENARTLAASAALRCNDLDRLGRLMLESHASLTPPRRCSTMASTVPASPAPASGAVPSSCARPGRPPRLEHNSRPPSGRSRLTRPRSSPYAPVLAPRRST
jgi:galactokinase